MVLIRNISGEDRLVADQDPAYWPADESREVTGEQAQALLAQPYFKRTDKGRGTARSSESGE